ncbi:hypothetical protein [Neptuniibacter marinus]|uniref:hypothetical protein n=1 Tax=Neptuniibacter marinus TaxID=1806670 RepID=UPI003B5ABA95
MSDDIQISIEITIEADTPIQSDNSAPPSQDDLLRCEMWARCECAYCTSFGCVNALGRSISEVH